MIQKVVDRLKRTRTKHVLLIILGGVVIYGFINPTIAEAVLSFLFGGIVPGTNVVVPPQIMILGAAGIVALIVLTLLIIWLIRVKDVRKASRQLFHDVEQVFDHKSHISEKSSELPAQMEVETDYQIAQPVQEEPLQVPVAVRTSYRVRFTRRTKQLRDKYASTARRYTAWLKHHTGHLGRMLVSYARVARNDLRKVQTWGRQTAWPMINTAAHRLYRLCLQVLVTLIALSRLTYRASLRALKRFGRFVRPYALSVDTWLELRYRRLKKWVSKTEAGQIVAVMGAETIASIRRLLRQLHK